MGVWLDRLVNREWQSWNELQKCSIVRPGACKPTEESEGAADKPQVFTSVLFSLGVMWRTRGGWVLKINALLFFFFFFKISTLWFKKHREWGISFSISSYGGKRHPFHGSGQKLFLRVKTRVGCPGAVRSVSFCLCCLRDWCFFLFLQLALLHSLHLLIIILRVINAKSGPFCSVTRSVHGDLIAGRTAHWQSLRENSPFVVQVLPQSFWLGSAGQEVSLFWRATTVEVNVLNERVFTGANLKVRVKVSMHDYWSSGECCKLMNHNLSTVSVRSEGACCRGL